MRIWSCESPFQYQINEAWDSGDWKIEESCMELGVGIIFCMQLSALCYMHRFKKKKKKGCTWIAENME